MPSQDDQKNSNECSQCSPMFNIHMIPFKSTLAAVAGFAHPPASSAADRCAFSTSELLSVAPLMNGEKLVISNAPEALVLSRAIAKPTTTTLATADGTLSPIQSRSSVMPLDRGVALSLHACGCPNKRCRNAFIVYGGKRSLVPPAELACRWRDATNLSSGQAARIKLDLKSSLAVTL
jgi:hypothetical protein